MTHSIDVLIDGSSFRLFAQRCLYWPQEQTLFVADLHLGKDATFVRNGIPVPSGTTAGTLATVGKCLRASGATRLCVLGDLFHARSSLSRGVREAVEQFLGAFADVEFLLVRGNHDMQVGRLPAAWPIREVEEGFRLGPLTLGHHPVERAGESGLYLCGHLHPAVRVGSGNDSLGRLPCFWHADGCLVLPALGEFTGTHVIRPRAGDQVWVTCGNEVFALPVGEPMGRR